MSRQFSGRQEFYPSRGGGTLGADRKAATALVYQEVVAGVLSTVAIQGDTGAIIAILASALNTDQIIINAAEVYVNALGGGSLYIDEGTYTMSANVAHLTDVYLYGSGEGTILTVPALTDNCIEVNNATGWKISLMTLQTTGIGPQSTLIVANSDEGEIFSVFIELSGRDGINVGVNCSNVNVHDNRISDCVRYGINNAGDDCQFSDNRINGTGDDGILLQAGGTNCIVTENRISNWVGEGIDNDEPTNQVAHNITAV